MAAAAAATAAAAYDDAAEILVVAAGGPLANPSLPEQARGELSAVSVVAVRGLHGGSSGRLLPASHRAIAQTQCVLGFASSAEALAQAREASSGGGVVSSWAGSVLGRLSSRWRAVPAGLVPLTRVSFSPCGRYVVVSSSSSSSCSSSLHNTFFHRRRRRRRRRRQLLLPK